MAGWHSADLYRKDYCRAAAGLDTESPQCGRRQQNRRVRGRGTMGCEGISHTTLLCVKPMDVSAPECAQPAYRALLLRSMPAMRDDS